MNLISTLFALVWAYAASQQAGPPRDQYFPIEGSNGTWVVNATERTGHAKMAPFLGRDALWLRASTHVIRTGSDMTDGTIEFDIAPMSEGDFAAVVFRRQSFAEHENVYLRLSRSNEFMALQYAPRIGGRSTWQLYPEFNATVAWPREAWTHVRIEIRGSGLEIFVGDAKTPALTVPRLRQAPANGGIALWARVNDKPDVWAAAISNLQIRPAATTTVPLSALPSPEGFVRSWDVGGPIASAADDPASLPASLPSWIEAHAEESGLVNLNRLVAPQRGRVTAFARVTIRADAAKRVRAGIGYSDDVTVFLNGEPVYSGRNGWESRTPGFASFVDTRFEKVWLPLRAGDNDLVLAVSDDQRFGWGFAVRFDSLDGLQFARGNRAR